MLMELSIRQFAIIKDLRINFDNGLNILTGETGAGKSIIIDAIQLIIGGRGSVEFIRNEADKAEIEALFDVPSNHQVFTTLSSLGINIDDDLIILKRELMKNGKSICRINGQLVTLSVLRDVGRDLIQLHTQNQHQSLLSHEKQLELLDAYGIKEIYSLKTEYYKIYMNYVELLKEMKRLTENEKETAQRIDLLEYQINEINKANLKFNEDEELEQQREKIRYAEKITNNLQNSYRLLNDENGITSQLFQVISFLEQISFFDDEIAKIHEQITSSFYQIEDASYQLTNHINNIDYEENKLNEIEERLAIIQHLKRKYGDSVKAIMEYAVTTEEELNSLINKEEYLDNIEKELKKIIEILSTLTISLSDKRKYYANKLSKEIEKELKDLQMVNADFKVSLYYEDDVKGIEIGNNKYHINQNGIDNVNFLISPNPGEPLKPINKIASGGELSRVMLAIQTILANKDEINTIIFDEIDTGVSGRTAQSIAEKLALVSKDKQVFVVTHLPQVASMADNHYLIKKKVLENNTYTDVKKLDEDRRIDELARMLGGVEVTSLTKKHAKEMIDNALNFKKEIK